MSRRSRRADMAQTILELAALGVSNAREFPWFEAPSTQSLDASHDLLFRLGALTGSKLTEIGKRIVEIPAHPRIGRLLLEAEKAGVVDSAALLAAFISEGQLNRMDALEMLGAPKDDSIRRLQSQLLSYFKKSRGERMSHDEERGKLAFSVLAGFPDRVARKRAAAASSARVKSGQTELVFSAGGSARVEETGIVAEGETFVALDIQERQFLGQARAEMKVRSLVKVQEEWLFDLQPPGIREEEELIWDAQKGAVTAVSRIMYDELTLAESRVAPKPSDSATRLLLKAGLGLDSELLGSMSPSDWVTALGKLGDPEAIEMAIARGDLYRKHFPEKAQTGRGISDALISLFQGKLSLRELRETDWAGEIVSVMTGQNREQVERMLPSHLVLPGGRRLSIHYPMDKAPWVESRLQDFFGMKQGPSLLGGRLPLTLHLLAPNQRAVQVTSDLAGFWERAYPAIRKELCRKYPRHSWPESPLQALPPSPRRR